MQKAVLSKVVGNVMIATKFSQKISDLGLMTANQLAKRSGILLRNHSSDKVNVDTIVHTPRTCTYSASLFDPYRHMIK